MLSKLGNYSCKVSENSAACRSFPAIDDSDSDCDSDWETDKWGTNSKSNILALVLKSKYYQDSDIDMLKSQSLSQLQSLSNGKYYE